MESEEVDAREIALASHRASARRAAKGELAFVAVDQSSLKLTDTQGEKGFGRVGAQASTRGLEVMTALAVSPAGEPYGLCGQRYWARGAKVAHRSKRQRMQQPAQEKELGYWLEVMEQVRLVFAEEAPQTTPWFQLDRGADAWPILLAGLREGDLFTVRAAQDRRLTLAEGEEERRYLWKTLEGQPLLGRKKLDVPARPARKPEKGKLRPARRARSAELELRAARVSLDLPGKNRASLYALLVCETADSAGLEEPIEWLLLTSRQISTRADADLVLFAYTQRWRIEEFHKCWKSGSCKVEETQLRSAQNVIRWATILASVAARLLRLTYLARQQPSRPSSMEFTTAEICAIVLSSRSRHKPGDNPPIGELVLLLANLGGYTGKSSGGPPGPLVIARGLLYIEPLVALLESGSIVAAPRSDQ
ncbi:MAG: IS4 family transposase [Bacteroidetes bacterium]|nr:IS4 family transposase [Bacteroidota bacterium]